MGIVTFAAATLGNPPSSSGRYPEAHLVEIAKASFHRFRRPPDGDLLVLYGLEMKYKWQDFFSAVFFASFLFVFRGVPLLPVLSGCLVAAFVTCGRVGGPAGAGPHVLRR